MEYWGTCGMGDQLPLPLAQGILEEGDVKNI